MFSVWKQFLYLCAQTPGFIKRLIIITSSIWSSSRTNKRLLDSIDMNNSGNHGSGQQQPPQQVQMPPSSGGHQLQIPGLLSPTGALEHYRLSQLYQYAMAAERLRCQPGAGGGAPGFLPPGLRPELAPFLYGPYCRIDPRLAMCRPPDEPKPQHSYIGLIAMAILSSADKKLVLSDIYQYILDNYPYFRTRGPGWRNSIRHNLSLNDCFIKSGRSANGKGHYWAIHPANVDDFTKGDFRRRKAQRKVRRHMGLAVDDEDSPSPPPSSPPPVNWPDHPHHPLLHHLHQVGQFHPHPHFNINHMHVNPSAATPLDFTGALFPRRAIEAPLSLTNFGVSLNRKRQFDVASLLAPEKGQRFPALSPASTIISEIEEVEQCHSSPSPPIAKVFKEEKQIESEAESDDTECDPIKVDEEKDVACKSPESSSDNNEADPTEETERKKVVRRRHHHCNNSGNSSGSSHRGERVTSPTNGSAGISSVSPGHGQASIPECQQQQIMLAGFGSAPPPPHPHHHAQHANFHFGPNHPHHLLQHNPSLASLMILSSRYRELTSSMANNSKRSSQ